MRKSSLTRLLARAAAAVVLGSALVAGAAPAQAGEGSYHCHVLVYGFIEDKYLAMKAENGTLGCPKDVEVGAANGGRRESFHGGDIYWHPRTGAHIVWGEILDKWNQYGRESGYGYPLTDELATPGGTGLYNHFQKGSIYFSSATGAHTVYGYIRDLWRTMGWERSCLGFPISDETDTPGGDGGRTQEFQGGKIYWTKAGGAHAKCA